MEWEVNPCPIMRSRRVIHFHMVTRSKLQHYLPLMKNNNNLIQYNLISYLIKFDL